MLQIDLGILLNIIGVILAFLSIILTILVALFGYFIRKFNNLINSVNGISNELEDLNDTTAGIERKVEDISNTIVRIDERTRNSSNDSTSADGSGLPLLDDLEDTRPQLLNISLLSSSNEIFGEDYASLIMDINEPVDNDSVQIRIETHDIENFILNDMFQSGIWIVSPEVVRNDYIRRTLQPQVIPNTVEVFIPVESGYQEEVIQEFAQEVDGFAVRSKEALIAAIHAYIISLELDDDDAHEIWRAEIEEIDDIIHS